MSLETIKSAGKKLTRAVAKNVTDSTALLLVASPIQAVADTFILEGIGKTLDALNINYMNMMSMTNENSINAKFGVAGITYLGAGWLYGRLRQVSRKAFGITDKTKERTQWLHDWIYTTAFSSGVLAGGYIYSQENDWWKIGSALAISAITQTVRGPLIGYSIDCYEDLLGFRECNRVTYPQTIKHSNRKIKVGVAILGIAASIALMAGLYSLTPKEWSDPNRSVERTHTQSLEIIVK